MGDIPFEKDCLFVHYLSLEAFNVKGGSKEPALVLFVAGLSFSKYTREVYS